VISHVSEEIKANPHFQLRMGWFIWRFGWYRDYERLFLQLWLVMRVGHSIRRDIVENHIPSVHLHRKEENWMERLVSLLYENSL